MKNKEKKQSFFYIIRRIFPMVFKNSPILFIVFIVFDIACGFLQGFTMYSNQLFYDSIENTIAGKAGISVWIAFSVFIGTKIFLQIIRFFSNISDNMLEGKSEKALGNILNKKAEKIPAICFEDNKFLTDITKASEGKKRAYWTVMLFTGLISFYLPYLTFLITYLYRLDKLLALSIIVIFIPVLITQFTRTDIIAKSLNKIAPLSRQSGHFAAAMSNNSMAKETRTLGIYGYLKKRYFNVVKEFNQVRYDAHFKSAVYEIISRAITLCGYFGVLLLLFNSVMNNRISIGAFAAVLASIIGMIKHLDDLMRNNIGEIAQNLSHVRNFINYLDIPEAKGQIDKISTADGISLRGVSFTYPEATTKAVENLSLDIKSGESIAIVGENGAGKSTLVRLITGMYMPDEGEVTIGGIDTKDIKPDILFETISGVFQRFQSYQMTLSENISISDTAVEAKEEYLDECLLKSGLYKDDRSFTKGYETMLSRKFGGVDLSGGQWQRIAIARGYYKEHEIIVLDEPTAAIDPLEETKIYNRFSDLSKGKTAIVVTHRLGSVRLTDKIVVMDKGCIAGIGIHDELLATCPIYATMWNAQAQWYA